MTVASLQTEFLLTLSMLKGIGPAALRKVAVIPNFQKLDITILAERLPQISRALSVDPDVWHRAIESAKNQIEKARNSNARIISALDPEYPSLLAATKDDPFLLFVQGKLAPNPEKSIAVIGTREPTVHGQRIATLITSFLAEQGWSIVSGLAIGCDATAHRAALACNGHTVAVLAHGLHMVAPARHKKLAEEILESGGALISEYLFGQDVQKQQYVKRDRTQAGLAQGVVMIQSDLVGGSLHASRATLDYNRWLAIPYPTEKDRERGESKIQANLTIADGTDNKKTELLRCSSDKLKNIFVIRSSEDYQKLILPLVDSGLTSHEVAIPLQNLRNNSITAFQQEIGLDKHYSYEASEFDQKSMEAGNEQCYVEQLRSNTVEILIMRKKYLNGKLHELDAFVKSLTDETTVSYYEAQFELESILWHMLTFVTEIERNLINNGILTKQIKAEALLIVREISTLQSLILSNSLQKASNEMLIVHDQIKIGMHVGSSVRVDKLRADFQSFANKSLNQLSG